MLALSVAFYLTAKINETVIIKNKLVWWRNEAVIQSMCLGWVELINKSLKH